MAARATLVLLDGDVPGLVALAVASERIAIDDTQLDAEPPLAMFDLSVEGHPARVAAAKAQAARFGAELISPSVALSGARDARTLTLMVAADEARRRGARAVLWPMWGGRLHADGLTSPEAIATELDRVELATRLSELDRGPHFEAPFIDLEHRPMADLAVDMDAPVLESWWGRHASPIDAEAKAARAAWTAPLREAGWRGELEPSTA